MKVWRYPLQVRHTNAWGQQPVQLEARCVTVINLFEEVKIDCLHEGGSVAAYCLVGEVTVKAKTGTGLPQGAAQGWVWLTFPVSVQGARHLHMCH